LQGAPSTRSGFIHTISLLVNVGGILLASVFLAVGFGSDPRWRGFRRTAMMLALLLVLAFILQFLTLHKGMPYGLANRLFRYGAHRLAACDFYPVAPHWRASEEWELCRSVTEIVVDARR
jgi:hypothetical protein